MDLYNVLFEGIIKLMTYLPRRVLIFLKEKMLKLINKRECS